MRKKSDFYFKIALVILDILALLSAFTIAYILRISLDPRPFHTSINAMDFITSIFYDAAVMDRDVLFLWLIRPRGLHTPIAKLRTNTFSVNNWNYDYDFRDVLY